MADVIRTVGAAGDETTIAAAITWMKNGANYTMGIDDIGIIRLIDDAEYAGTGLSLSGFTGTASASSHVRLEAASGNECLGKFQKARIRNTTASNHVINGTEDYLHIKNIAIQQNNTTDSDECIRLSSGASNVLIEKCFLETNNTTNQDHIYAGNFAVTDIYVFDCVFKFGGTGSRAAIHAQNFNGTNTQSWHVEHVTVNCNGNLDTDSAGIRIQHATGNTVNFGCWNSLVFDNGSAPCYENTGSGTGTATGQGNIGSDTTCTSVYGATNNQDSLVVNATDTGTTDVLITTVDSDYQLLDGANTTNSATANAVDGATRDSRCDTTTDIAGNARATYASGERDTGAFQIAGYTSGSSIIPQAKTYYDLLRRQ